MSEHQGNSLNQEQQEALFGICLLAAFSDGSKADTEREELKRLSDDLICESLSTKAIYRDVLLKTKKLDDYAPALKNPETAQLAYELAVGVCDSDGTLNDAERAFLAELSDKLRLDKSVAQSTAHELEKVATAPPEAVPDLAPALKSVGGTNFAHEIGVRYATLTAALELLPQSIATMAVLPAQMKMVYEIGKQHGVSLDAGHIREFLAIAGIGLTSQVVEGFARKFLGGLAGKFGGGMAKGLAGQASSSVISFATTYALAQVAAEYYASGRKLTTAQVRQTFEATVERAKGLYDQYSPSIREQSQNLNLPSLISSFTGKSGGI